MVKNSLAVKDQHGFENTVVEYECGADRVRLTPKMIKAFLVSGDGRVTDQEVMMFLNLCKYQHLNPFLREAYLIKYGSQPATIVTGKDAFAKRARRNKSYGGCQAGVVVQLEDGTIDQRVGTLTVEGETLVGGWAKVFVKGDEVPTETTVSLDEYIGRKKDGTVNSQWKSKPATMIRKVALVQALREAFPEDYQGLYVQEEMDIADIPLPEAPVSPNAPVPPSAGEAEPPDAEEEQDPLA